ncbi:MAG: hypothetical protein WA869_27260 [Alloacidobacterium sp.]
MRPEALAAARQIVNLCGFFPTKDPQRIAALTTSFDGPLWPQIPMHRSQPTRTEYGGSPTRDTFADRARPRGRRRATGRYATEAFVTDRCATGQRLEYWTFARLDHGTIVQPGTSLDERLVAWTAARFANEAQASGCTRKPF